MNPVLSIVIPVYNVEKYLCCTLDNIVCQERFADCEVLLINDGSTDNSLSILKEYERNFKNIRVLDKENEGVSVTRNRGIDESSGEYIYFMDADDMLHPQAIATIIEEIETNNADIVTWNFTTFYSKPRFAKLSKITFAEVDNSDRRAFNYLVEKGCAVSLWNKAIRRSLFEGPIIRLIPGMTYGEDMFVSWKCILKARSIRYLGFPLYYYRQTGNSAISRFHPGLYETYRRAFDDLKEFIIGNNLQSEELFQDLDYHFAKRLPSLTMMETRAPYSSIDQNVHLATVLKDEYISRALKSDNRLSDEIYDLARCNATSKMLKKSRRTALKNKLLLPIKKLLK